MCRPFFYLEHCVLAGLCIGIRNKFCGVAQQLLESIMTAEDGDPYTDEGRSKSEGVKVTFSLVFMHLTLKSSLYHSCASLYWCLSLFGFVVAVNWICRFVFLLFVFLFFFFLHSDCLIIAELFNSPLSWPLVDLCCKMSLSSSVQRSLVLGQMFDLMCFAVI